MVKDGKRTLAVMAERVNHFIPNPTFDPITNPVAWICCFAARFPKASTRPR
jgi:hypothetical protein